MLKPKRYWFRARSHGLGWGLPLTWQGWVSAAVFLGLIPVVVWLFPPATHELGFLGSLTALVVAFMVLCARTGEPPRWRWGDK